MLLLGGVRAEALEAGLKRNGLKEAAGSGCGLPMGLTVGHVEAGGSSHGAARAGNSVLHQAKGAVCTDGGGPGALYQLGTWTQCRCCSRAG